MVFRRTVACFKGYKRCFNGNNENQETDMVQGPTGSVSWVAKPGRKTASGTRRVGTL